MTTPAKNSQAAREEIIGLKLYPAGITTQSENGVRNFDRIGETVALLEELDIPLLVHGESDGFVMDREREFLSVYRWLAENFPRLRIGVMEHITTADAVELLEHHDNLAATVTLHHTLMITLDDVAGGLLQPDLFCKPIAKTPKDRDALQLGRCLTVVWSSSAVLWLGPPLPIHGIKKSAAVVQPECSPPLLPYRCWFNSLNKNDCLGQLPGFVSHPWPSLLPNQSTRQKQFSLSEYPGRCRNNMKQFGLF